MYGPEVRRAALSLADTGRAIKSVARELGVSRSAVREWLNDPEKALAVRLDGRCFVCGDVKCAEPDSYAYLLGQYLGDGHLVTRARVPALRVYACADYPAIVAEIVAAVTAVRGSKPGCFGTPNSQHVTKIQSYWKHWPCLLPQHGPGMKHTRPILLEAWQQEIAAEHPWSLIRGLIHSDGCRAINRVKVHGVRYSYPRYFFANESGDILAIMGAALDRVGVPYRYNRPNSISIARRAAVAAMDAHVGPKT